MGEPILPGDVPADLVRDALNDCPTAARAVAVARAILGEAADA